MYLGIDLGTTYVKTSNERVFPSGISENIYLSNNIMEIEGQKYAMGLFNSKAILDININKCLNRNTKLNFLYALFQESLDNNYVFKNVVVGLPCSQWKNENTVNQFKKLLLSQDFYTIKLNGFEKHIIVENIDVVPEGSTAYYAVEYEKFEGRKVLILDCGGLTLNSLLFENDQLIDLHTDELGVLKVYKNMAEKITTETGINVQLEDMLDIIQFATK